jgi:hypothetical protein
MTVLVLFLNRFDSSIWRDIKIILASVCAQLIVPVTVARMGGQVPLISDIQRYRLPCQR